MKSMIGFASALASTALAQAPLAPFERLRLTSDYYSEGVNVGDFDQDGMIDVVSGPFWWRGPEFVVRHTIYPPVAFPIGGYSSNFFSFVFDVDNDSWLDVVTVGFPAQAAHWYENPGPQQGLWPQHLLFGSVAMESPTLQQLVAGGPPELVCGSGTSLGYLTPDATDPTSPWLFHAIASAPIPLTFLHGLGVGDVDDDGRLDVLTGVAWFEQPASLVGDPPWTPHFYSFGLLSGAQMFAYDVDGDGDNDLISSRNAHGYGLSWFEHVVVAGEITFVEHVILPSNPSVPVGAVQFSQLHALDLRDVDGDGLLDIVTGKSFWAHLGGDPGATDPAVLYWFRLQRSGGTASYTAHLVDDDSGVGRQVVCADVSDDERADIVVGNKKGVFVFRRSSFWSDIDTVTITAGGTQQLLLDASVGSASALYLIVGSMSGSSPGINLGAVHVPLNPDSYTSFVLAAAPTVYSQFLGVLDVAGRASASFHLPAGLPLAGPFDLHHAFVVFDGQGAIAKASNAVALTLQ